MRSPAALLVRPLSGGLSWFCSEVLAIGAWRGLQQPSDRWRRRCRTGPDGWRRLGCGPASLALQFLMPHCAAYCLLCTAICGKRVRNDRYRIEGLAPTNAPEGWRGGRGSWRVSRYLLQNGAPTRRSNAHSVGLRCYQPGLAAGERVTTLEDDDVLLGPRSAAVAWLEDGAHLYAVTCGNRVKVGVSNDPARRVQSIAAAERCPARLIDTAEVPHGLALTAESYAHWLLRDRHLIGEWFNVEPCVAVAAIHRSASQMQATLPVPAFARVKRWKAGAQPKTSYNVSRPYWPGWPARPAYAEEEGGSL